MLHQCVIARKKDVLVLEVGLGSLRKSIIRKATFAPGWRDVHENWTSSRLHTRVLYHRDRLWYRDVSRHIFMYQEVCDVLEGYCWHDLWSISSAGRWLPESRGSGASLSQTPEVESGGESRDAPEMRDYLRV
jgi:hypothetical protein